MANAQKFRKKKKNQPKKRKKSRNMIRIERMFIFKQEIRNGLKFILRIVQRKILLLH